MKKIILVMLMLSCYCGAASETTRKEIDNNIERILLRTTHRGEPSKEEMIRQYQNIYKLSDIDIQNSLYRLMQDREDTFQEEITCCAIAVLEELGNSQSIEKIEVFINNEDPLARISRIALFTTTILSGYEFKRVNKYIKICKEKKKMFLVSSLFKRLLSAYNNTKNTEQKAHLKNVITKMIELLDKYNHSYRVKERLEKEKLGWMLDGLTLVNQNNDPRKTKPQEMSSDTTIWYWFVGLIGFIISVTFYRLRRK